VKVSKDLKANLLFRVRFVSILKADQDVGMRHPALLVFDRVRVTAHLGFQCLNGLKQITYSSEYLLLEEKVLQFLKLCHEDGNGDMANVSPRSALWQILLNTLCE